ncbi:MAG: hypothetical protein ACKOCQ_01270 [Candidatus Nitrosotenuis sp.]
MIELDGYFKRVLQQISDSYDTLENLSDKSGDLDTIKRELAKTNGALLALANKLQANKQELEGYQYLLKPIRLYLENYEFFREIGTMAPLYSDDPFRLKNLRLSVLSALRENNLLEHVRTILR